MRSKILENQVRSGQLSSGHVFGQQATSRPLVWKGRGTQRHSRMCPPVKRSFVTFDRGGQTGPPRSNYFFFGAADGTRAARTSGRTSGRTPSRTPGRTPADDTGAADVRPTSDDTDVPGQLFSRTTFREYPVIEITFWFGLVCFNPPRLTSLGATSQLRRANQQPKPRHTP